MTGQAVQGFAASLSKTIYPHLDVPFELGVGHTAVVPNDIEITILNIQDSRCPADVTCVWMGEAKISINVVKDLKDLGNFVLSTIEDKTTLSFDIFTITLVQVQPYPYSSKEIPPSDYVVTLLVSDTTNIPSPLKQLRSGVAASEIKCKPSLQLIIKLRDGSPACVKEKSVARLVMQGWALNGKSTVTLTEGQKNGSLLVQEIYPDHIVGLNFPEYPLAREEGLPVTLKIGETASNGCTIMLTLEKIVDKKATFSKTVDFGRPCPIC